MGASRGDFHKYPRTPHLTGSQGTSDDKHLGSTDTRSMVCSPSLIVEEKLDGTNVGLHFVDAKLGLQCRGHEITAGMHPQYDLFKQWAIAKQNSDRNARVPWDVIQRLIDKLDPPTLAECHELNFAEHQCSNGA